MRNSDENETTPEDSRLEFLEEKHKIMTSLEGLLYVRFIWLVFVDWPLVGLSH